MKRVNIALIILAALFTASCTDFDNNLSEAEIRYNQNFIDQFGNIDPNQDWNMAQQVTANLDLSGVRGKATVKIFEADPLATVNAKYLSYIDVTNGVANWKFDAPKSAKELFVHVMQNGVRLYGGYCNVENGTMNISETSLHKKTIAKVTRAMGGAKGEEKWSEITWDETKTTKNVIINLNGYQNFVEQIQISDEKNYVLYTPDVTTTAFRKLEYNYDGSSYKLDNTYTFYYEGGTEVAKTFCLGDYVTGTSGNYAFKSGVKYSHKYYRATTYAINGNTEVDRTNWLIGDCKDLFWVGDAPFLEGEDYRSAKHIKLYNDNGVELSDVERGVLFTTSKDKAEIEIPMMFGATQNNNILGYYYYREGDDPRSVNRYILYDDARPSTNITVDKVAVGGMDLQSMKSGWTDKSIVSCVTRKLLFFGYDGQSAGTTEFPENLKIGFFIRRQPANDNPFNSLREVEGETGFAYSTPDMNLYHLYQADGTLYNAGGWNAWSYRGSDGTEVSVEPVPTRGNVKAISWTYGGRKLVGFGDDSGDCDLNDFVFWVNGDVTTDSKIKIETKDKDDAYEWVVACEDLGSTDDYDFNDVVFGIRNYKHVTTLYTSFYDETGQLVTKVPEIVDKKNYLVVTPYAAGGVLKSNIFYYDGGLLGNERDLGEIHSLLNLSEKATYDATASGKMPMLNTTSRTYEGHPVVIQLGNDEVFSIAPNVGDKNISNFKVKVTSANGDLANASEATVINAPDKGTVPQMLVVPCGWDWPTERTGITEAYPDFTAWVSDATLATWNSHKSGSVISNPYQPSANDNDDDDDNDDVDYSAYGTELSFSNVTLPNNPNTYIGVDINALKAISTTGPVVITLICSEMDQWNKNANAIYYQENNKGWVDDGRSSTCDYENKKVTITLDATNYNKFITPEVEYDKGLIQLTNITVKKMFIKVPDSSARKRRLARK